MLHRKSDSKHLGTVKEALGSDTEFDVFPLERHSRFFHADGIFTKSITAV